MLHQKLTTLKKEKEKKKKQKESKEMKRTKRKEKNRCFLNLKNVNNHKYTINSPELIMILKSNLYLLKP